MRLTSLRKRASSRSGVTGTARLDRNTRSLARRARPGDIAVLDHVDIDRGAAMALVDAGVSAVVDVAPAISGRYPCLGAEVLVDNGVVLLDQVEADIFSAVSDGDPLRIEGDLVYAGDEPVGAGNRHDRASVAEAMSSSREGMADQLVAFSANAVEFLRREQGLLLDGDGVPEIRTHLSGRAVVVVDQAFDYRSELRGLRRFIREESPVLVGVDAGADALIDAGYAPDLVVTAGLDVSDAALRCGAEVVAHRTDDGRLAGGDRLERLGLDHSTFVAAGTSRDAAVLLAHASDARLIVQVGGHADLVEFLDQGRSAMASSFLTTMAAGSRLVDARAVAQLYAHRMKTWLVLLLLLVATVAVAAALVTTPVGQGWYDQVEQWVRAGYAWAQGAVR